MLHALAVVVSEVVVAEASIAETTTNINRSKILCKSPEETRGFFHYANR
jgi:hypothetical protein